MSKMMLHFHITYKHFFFCVVIGQGIVRLNFLDKNLIIDSQEPLDTVRSIYSSG